jgi:hypothetical protein
MKSRELRLLIAFVCVLSVIGASYAVTKVAVQNTSQINTGLNIFITQPTLTTTPPTCAATGNAVYKNTGFQSIFWNLTAGDTGQLAYFCIDNQGSVQDALQITLTCTSTGCTSTNFAQGSCPNPTGAAMNYVINVPPADTPLAPHSATVTAVSVNVCAGGNEALGTGPQFTISVQ